MQPDNSEVFIELRCDNLFIKNKIANPYYLKHHESSEQATALLLHLDKQSTCCNSVDFMKEMFKYNNFALVHPCNMYIICSK